MACKKLVLKSILKIYQLLRFFEKYTKSFCLITLSNEYNNFI